MTWCRPLLLLPLLCLPVWADTAESEDPRSAPTEAEFRYQLNDDAMATEKLAEGIRNFVIDQVKLEQVISAL